MLFITCKQWIAKMKLGNDASKAPDINFSVVGQTKDNLWSPIIPTLYIGVNSFFLKATGAKINYLNSRFICLFQ